MNRETILIIAVILSLFLVVYTTTKIKKLHISNPNKGGLFFLTVMIPLLGFIVTKVLEAKEARQQ